jgi:hypothetical protein
MSMSMVYTEYYPHLTETENTRANNRHNPVKFRLRRPTIPTGWCEMQKSKVISKVYMKYRGRHTRARSERKKNQRGVQAYASPAFPCLRSCLLTDRTHAVSKSSTDLLENTRSRTNVLVDLICPLGAEDRRHYESHTKT